MASDVKLTDWTDPRPWIATEVYVAQKAESLTLQFKYGSGTYRDAIRFLANGDVRLLGELVTENGALRSYATFAMTVYNTGTPQDVVSFRSGAGAGTEVLRITSNGTVQAATSANLKLAGVGIQLQADRSGTATTWGTITFDTTTTERVLDCSGVLVTDPLRVKAQEFRLDAWDAYNSAFARWARLTIQNSSNSPRRLSAQTSSGTVKDLELEGEDVKLRTLSTLGGVDLWGSFERGGAGSSLFVPDNLFIEAKSGANYKNILLSCYKFEVSAQNDDCIRFKDSSAAVRFHFRMTGQETITARDNEHASLTVDSTATSGAKKWTLRADKAGSPAGSLKFINETDGGTPTVEFEPTGAIYSPGYIGPKTTTAAPSDTDGRVGAIAVDTSNKRIWVKVTDSGSNRWWYAALVTP